MILVNANLLIYAYDSTAQQHPKARICFGDALSKPDPVLLPWICMQAFIRIATNPRALRNPLSVQEAVFIVDEWLSVRNVSVPEPGERHWPILRALPMDAQCRGPLVPDAILAALAIENGATLCTNDRDFSRFRNLKILNPT